MNKIIVIFLCMVSSPLLAAPNFSAINESAILANAAYADKRALLKQLDANNHTLIRYKILAGSEVSYFLSSKNNRQFIAIRGTANLENVMVDLDVNLKLDEKLNIQLHQGFSATATAVYDDIKTHIVKGQPVQTTGHSLGGAVAVIVAMYLQRDGYDLQPFITFGQPKVTNLTGANDFENLPLIRVVTPEDIVPIVPPLSPLQLKSLYIYWHIGQEIILMNGNQYAITSGLKSMFRATKFTSALPSERNLHAHKMATYLKHIKHKLESSEEVPYQTNYSVFGLSLD